MLPVICTFLLKVKYAYTSVAQLSTWNCLSPGRESESYNVMDNLQFNFTDLICFISHILPCFTMWKTPKFGLDFPPWSPLSCFCFEVEQCIWNPKQTGEGPCLVQLSLLTAEKMRRQIRPENSITQTCISQCCWDLVCGCTRTLWTGRRMLTVHFQSNPRLQKALKLGWLNHGNSAVDCLILLTLGRLVYYGSTELALWLKPRTTSGTGGLKWQCIGNCYCF